MAKGKAMTIELAEFLADWEATFQSWVDADSCYELNCAAWERENA